MSYSNLTGKARKQFLLLAKRQRVVNTMFLREDKDPIPFGTTFKSLYSDLNVDLFGGSLPDIPVVGNPRLRRSLGKAFYRVDTGGVLVPTRIEMKSSHRWTSRFKRKVLTHEMCHVWAYQYHNEPGHGRMFWKKMEELGYPKFHDWADSTHLERDVYC